MNFKNIVCGLLTFVYMFFSIPIFLVMAIVLLPIRWLKKVRQDILWLRQSFKSWNLWWIIFCNNDYTCNAGDYQEMPKCCPKCNILKNGLRPDGSMLYEGSFNLWSGSVKVFGIFDIGLSCEEACCNNCGYKWIPVYYVAKKSADIKATA